MRQKPRGRRKYYMSKSISASLGLVSMLAALACSSTGGSAETTNPSNIGSLGSSQLADGGVDVGDAGDVVVNDAGDAAL
jgi:hypothetical protein